MTKFIPPLELTVAMFSLGTAATLRFQQDFVASLSCMIDRERRMRVVQFENLYSPAELLQRACAQSVRAQHSMRTCVGFVTSVRFVFAFRRIEHSKCPEEQVQVIHLQLPLHDREEDMLVEEIIQVNINYILSNH